MLQQDSGNAARTREQLERGYNLRDMDLVLSYYDPDPVFIDHALQVRLTSIEEIREYVASQWAPSSEDGVADLEVLESGDWTVARFTNRGVNDRPWGDLPATNKPFQIELCTVTRWRNGKIVEDHVYYDLHGLIVQLGFAEPLTAEPQAI